MNDSQFDDFVNNKLNEYAAPVPAGLWEKVAEGQFDQFIGSKLRNAEAPVPGGLWEKIADNQFDNFVADKIDDHQVPVPGGLWDRITDGQFDNFVAGKLIDHEAPVPGGLWDKITDGQFDGFVAGKLLDHEAPVPAGLWEKVRPEEDDDKVGFFWFRYPAAAILILGLLTAVAWGGYVYFSKKNTTVETTQSGIPGTNGTPGNKSSLQPVTKTTDHVNTVAPLNNNVAPSNNNDTKANRTDVNAGVPSTANEKVNIVPENNLVKETTTNYSDKPLNNKAAVNAGHSSSSHEHTVASSTSTKTSASRLTPPPVNNDVTNNAYDIFKNNTTAVTNGSDQTVANSDDVYVEPKSFFPISTVSSRLNGYNGLSDKQLSTLNHTNQFRSVIICPTDRRNTDWFLEAYASPDIAMKSVSNVSATPLYMLKKDSSESMQIGYSAGVRLVKPITDNILLKAGIQYTQANQKYVYRTENEVKTTTVVTVRTIIRAPGDTVVVQDTSILQTIGFKNNTVSNHFRSFDIPVTIGYQFGDEDLKFGINAGVVVNLSSWYQGVILDSSLAIVPLDKSGNMVYKTNIGLGLYGSISVVKRLSDDMHIFVEPYFRYNLSNMTTPQASFKQKLNIGGLSVGLRFNLNRK